MLLFAATLAVGCGKSVSDKEDVSDDVDKNAFSESRVTNLADKFAEGKFTEKDYAQAIDIYEAYNEALFEKAESLVKSVRSREEFNRKIHRFQNKYAYINELNNILFMDEDRMGSENYQRFQKCLSRLQDQANRIMEQVDAKPLGGPNYSSDSETVAVETVEVAAEDDYCPATDSAK